MEDNRAKGGEVKKSFIKRGGKWGFTAGWALDG
jgi:hypothetical protein